jgi:electron transfer flavoprotein beta subunit
VGVQLAESLDLPAITNIEELTLEDERNIGVKRMLERGYIRARLKLPAVITVTSKINQPRLASILNIMAATQKEITCWNAADISADTGCVGFSGSPTRFYQMSEFHARRQGDILRGKPEEVVARAIDKLTKMGVL